MACNEPMIPSPMNPTSSAMSATSRRLDAQLLTGSQATPRLRGRLFAVQQVAPLGARLAACRAGRGVATALGQQRVVHLGQRRELAHDAVAARVLAAAARAAP